MIPSFERRACPLQPVKVRTSERNARSWLGCHGHERRDHRGEQAVQAVSPLGRDSQDRCALREPPRTEFPGRRQVGLAGDQEGRSGAAHQRPIVNL